MRRNTFAWELNRVLAPLGFKRESSKERVWSRVRGDHLETVDLQSSWLGGTTSNLCSHNLKFEALCKTALPNCPPLIYLGYGERIGHLIDRYDRWWSNDPEGHRALADAVAAHAPAYFDKELAPIDPDEIRTLAANPPEWAQAMPTINLALLLHFQGDGALACKVLDRRLSKFTDPSWVEQVETVRRWLGCPPRSGPPPIYLKPSPR